MVEPYTFYTRPSKKYRKIYYVRFRDPETGERLPGISTKTNKQVEAYRFAEDYLKSGLVTSKANMLFKDYTRNFFVWGKSQYITDELTANHRFSEQYAEECNRHYENHILPYFGDIKMRDLSVKKINDFVRHLLSCKTKGGTTFSSSTVNAIYGPLKKIIKSAYKEGDIDEDFTEKTLKVSKSHQKSKPFKNSLYQQLIDKESINKIWNNNYIHYAMNLLAAVTGMRQGEIRGLRLCCIHDDHVSVEKQWLRNLRRLGPPKYDSVRNVPIPKYCSKILKQLIDLHPNNHDRESLLFFGDTYYAPIDHKEINNELYKALETLKIPNLERKKQHYVFHSWRHSFNTLLRGKVHDSKIKCVMGHKPEDMTDHYTDYELSDLKDVNDIQNALFS